MRETRGSERASQRKSTNRPRFAEQFLFQQLSYNDNNNNNSNNKSRGLYLTQAHGLAPGEAVIFRVNRLSFDCLDMIDHLIRRRCSVG